MKKEIETKKWQIEMYEKISVILKINFKKEIEELKKEIEELKKADKEIWEE